MTLSVQFSSLLVMIGLGVWLGIAIDTYKRLLHKEGKKGINWFVMDILFWLCQAIGIFFILFQVNAGEMRFYFFIALLCGFAMYQSLFKSFYLKRLEGFLHALLTLWRLFIGTLNLLLWRPVYLLVLFLLTILLGIGKGLLTLVKAILFVVRWVVIYLSIYPILKIFKLIWGFLPKNFKFTCKNGYNRITQFLKRLINKVKKGFFFWK
jgi:spore cortex biosynthesis protein YabQ